MTYLLYILESRENGLTDRIKEGGRKAGGVALTAAPPYVLTVVQDVGGTGRECGQRDQ